MGILFGSGLVRLVLPRAALRTNLPMGGNTPSPSVRVPAFQDRLMMMRIVMLKHDPDDDDDLWLEERTTRAFEREWHMCKWCECAWYA